MKLIDEPVAVVAGFEANGTVHPMLIRHARTEYKITHVKWWKYGEPIWSPHPSRLFCVSIQGDRVGS